MERKKDFAKVRAGRKSKMADLSEFKVTVEWAKPSPDDEMTSEQRRDAIADLLATAAVRMHHAEQKMIAELKTAQAEIAAPAEIGTSEWNFILSE